jgi:hypothetical protein
MGKNDIKILFLKYLCIDDLFTSTTAYELDFDFKSSDFLYFPFQLIFFFSTFNNSASINFSPSFSSN